MIRYRLFPALVTLLGVAAGATSAAAEPAQRPFELRLSSIVGGVQSDPLAPSGEEAYVPPAYTSTPGYHEHDGFYFRLLTGPAVLAAATDEDAGDLSISGWGWGIGLAAGAAIAPNVIVYGELFGKAAVDVTIDQDGTEFETDDTSLSLGGLGGGIAIYLPNNIYLSGTLAFARLVFDPNTDRDDDEGSTDIGGALLATVGKEWWVSANWGLGVALQLSAAGMNDRESELGGGEDVTFGAFGAMLAFSATLN